MMILTTRNKLILKLALISTYLHLESNSNFSLTMSQLEKALKDIERIGNG